MVGEYFMTLPWHMAMSQSWFLARNRDAGPYMKLIRIMVYLAFKHDLLAAYLVADIAQEMRTE